MKKRIIIVDCNAKIGGVQKALMGLLSQIHDRYDVTLLLLDKNGPLLQEIPKDVRVLETRSDFRYMGMAQSDCVSVPDKIRRGAYALLTRCAGRERAVNWAIRTLRRDHLEAYDVAIAYSHIASSKLFYGGAAEYVLRGVRAKKKICYIHCDYLNSGNRSAYSDRLYAEFDAIACVCEAARAQFVRALPHLADRVHAAGNCVDAQRIMTRAQEQPVIYDRNMLNLLVVARLTGEKGVDRLIRVLGRIHSPAIRCYIVGDGQERGKLEALIEGCALSRSVTLLGETLNPYRHMLAADLLVVPSYHEAAPIVFQEAKALGLPVLTTRTLSADEMIGERFGFVADNDEDALEETLRRIAARPQLLREKRAAMAAYAAEAVNPQPAIVDMIGGLLK